MPALPLLGLPVLWIALLLATKLGRMHAPPPVHPLPRNHLMQHFMEHDIFDNIARHEGLIERAVNPDELVSRLIRAKTYRCPRTFRGLPRPGNARLDAIGKIGLIQGAEDAVEVEVMPLRLKSAGALLWLGRATDEMTMTVNIGSYGALSYCIRVAYIDEQGMPHTVWCLAKHAVQPHPIARRHMPFDREHDGTVIGPCDRHRRSQLVSEPELSIAREIYLQGLGHVKLLPH